MRTAAAALVLVGLVASPVGGQERGRGCGQRAQGIPPGHLPPSGECRVWYDDRPAGQQPPPTGCREAERVASRDRYARVIYGGDRGRDDGWWDRDDDRRGRGRAIPRGDRYPYPERSPYPERYPYPESRSPYPGRYPSEQGRYGYGSVPFDNGFKDGYDKGREDARDRHAYGPVRHSRYRSADRGAVLLQLLHCGVKPSAVDVEVAARRGQVCMPRILLTKVTGTPASSNRDPAS